MTRSNGSIAGVRS